MAAEIRRGKKRKIEEEDRKKLQGKNIMAPPLLHRAAINSPKSLKTFFKQRRNTEATNGRRQCQQPTSGESNLTKRPHRRRT